MDLILKDTIDHGFCHVAANSPVDSGENRP